MNKIKISDDEFIYYLHEEWENNIQTEVGELWLSTQAFQKRLAERGIIISWPTIERRLIKYADEDRIEKIQTSFGPCWKSKGKNFVL